VKFGVVEVSGEALSSDLRERVARRQSRDIPNGASYESAIVHTPNPIGRFQFDIGVGTEQAIRLEAGLRCGRCDAARSDLLGADSRVRCTARRRPRLHRRHADDDLPTPDAPKE